MHCSVHVCIIPTPVHTFSFTLIPLPQVLVEKLGVPDADVTRQLVSQREANPGSHPRCVRAACRALCLCGIALMQVHMALMQACMGLSCKCAYGCHTLDTDNLCPAAPSCSPACTWYCSRAQQLALLEFDRDRKSMSVLVGQAGAGRGEIDATLASVRVYVCVCVWK